MCFRTKHHRQAFRDGMKKTNRKDKTEQRFRRNGGRM